MSIKEQRSWQIFLNCSWLNLHWTSTLVFLKFHWLISLLWVVVRPGACMWTESSLAPGLFAKNPISTNSRWNFLVLLFGKLWSWMVARMMSQWRTWGRDQCFSCIWRWVWYLSVDEDECRETLSFSWGSYSCWVSWQWLVETLLYFELIFLLKQNLCYESHESKLYLLFPL